MPSVESYENKAVTMSQSVVQSNKSLSAQNSSEFAEATISVKVYDNLIAELRCPSCACPMKAPIKLCESGHSVCNLCTKMLAKCPLCSKSFTEIRSLTLEALSAKAQFRCSNSSLGCPVRLQLNLLGKHEEHCAYQLGDCFMGKVWGNCKWHGREIDWIDHCELDHREKVFFGAEVTRAWELRVNAPKSICAYFIFRVFGETFDFYQIYDNLRKKLCWTMVCASKDPNVAKKYAFELELFSPSDETKINIQRNPCHSDRDADILRDGKCAVFDLGEIMRFMDENRVLHYRIKVIENSQSKRSSIARVSPISPINTNNVNNRRSFETDFSQTNIEGSNIKRIPSEKIITRRSTYSARHSIALNGSLTETAKDGLSVSSKKTSNGMPESSPNPKENRKSSLKSSPIAGLKRMLSNSSTNLFKPIKFGSRKSISGSSPTEPSSPVKTPLNTMTQWEQIGKTDSIDRTIIENNDLKRIFVRSYNIDVKNIDDLLDENRMSFQRVNSIPKPPRISLDVEKENAEEIQLLLKENINGATSPPTLEVGRRLVSIDIKND